MARTSPAPRGSRLGPILLASGVALAAGVWLSRVNPPLSINDDGIRDQLLVRDCTDLGRCHLIGAYTSLSPFYQGAVWLDLLAAVRLVGGDLNSQRWMVLALLALSVATLFVVVWRWLRRSIALPAAVLLTAALGLDTNPGQLVNASASPFTDVLVAAGLLCYGLSGAPRFLILAAFALGAGINVHIGSASLVPALVAIAVLRRRQWRELLAAVAVLFATCFLTSRAALLVNVLGLASRGWLLSACAGGLGLVLLSAWLGSRFERLSRDGRAWVIGCILVMPFGLASLWLVVAERHHFGIPYLHPILAPAAVLAAGLVSLPFEIAARWLRALRWIPTAVVLIVLAFVVAHTERTPAVAPAERPWGIGEAGTPWQSWTVGEAQAVAQQVVKRGWNYEELVFHIQSRACRELLVAMSLSAPAPTVARTHGRWQLQVVKASRDAVSTLAGSLDVVPLGSSAVAVLQDVESWLEPEALIACLQPVGSEAPPVCSAVNQQVADILTADRFLFATRSFPEIHNVSMSTPYVVTYQIPLLPIASASRVLALADRPAPGCDGWRITRVEGLQVEGQLPAEQVRLYSDSGKPGVLVIEKRFDPTPCGPNAADMRYPPCVFEMDPNDPLLAVAEAG